MAARYQKQVEDHSDSLLTKIVKDITMAYDWLSGPAMTARDRNNREAAEARPVSTLGNFM